MGGSYMIIVYAFLLIFQIGLFLISLKSKNFIIWIFTVTFSFFSCLATYTLKQLFLILNARSIISGYYYKDQIVQSNFACILFMVITVVTAIIGITTFIIYRRESKKIK